MPKYSKVIGGEIRIAENGVTTYFSISNDSARRIALNHFCEATGWNPEWYIENDYVMIDKEYATSHRWSERNEVRPATDEDRVLCAAYQKMKVLQ